MIEEQPNQPGLSTKQLTYVIVGTLVVLSIVIIGLFVVRGDCRDFDETTLQAGTTNISVALAITEVEQSRGLAGCTSIPENSGMYFPYEVPKQVSFWMRGMNIPIDIVWIRDGQVIGVLDHVPPLTSKTTIDPPRYKPPQPVTGVLELGAGKAQELGITQGTPVTLTQ